MIEIPGIYHRLRSLLSHAKRSIGSTTLAYSGRRRGCAVPAGRGRAQLDPDYVMADARDYQRGLSGQSAERSARDLQRVHTRQRTCKRRARYSDIARDIAALTTGVSNPPRRSRGRCPSKPRGCSRRTGWRDGARLGGGRHRATSAAGKVHCRQVLVSMMHTFTCSVLTRLWAEHCAASSLMATSLASRPSRAL